MSAGCDPYGRQGGLGYPPLGFQIARWAGLSGEWTNLLAVVLGIGFVALIAIYLKGLKQRNAALNLVSAMVLVSFPAQLALERMNLDVALLISICLVAFLRQWEPRGKARRVLWILLASVIAASATAIKIYPGIGIIAWLSGERIIQKNKNGADLAIAIGSLAGLLSALPWIWSGDGFASPPISVAAHGLQTGRDLGEIGPTATLASVAVLIGAYLWTKKGGVGVYNVKTSDRHQPPEDWTRDIGFLGFIIWLCSYCLTTSFDYRLIYIFPFLLYIVGLESRRYAKPNQWSAQIQTAVIIVLLYMAIPLIYMATENATSFALIAGFQRGELWLIAPTIGRYASAAASRILNYAGLPIFAGIGLGYIFNTWTHRESDNRVQHKELPP